MASRGPGAAGSKVKKVMTQPISVIFRMLQNKQRVQIWLYEQTSLR
jgi:small nuclear ribonucleoprotein E